MIILTTKDNSVTKGNELYHIKPLDGLRAIAIGLIVIQHYFHALIDYDTFPGSKYLKIATAISWAGVDLFFVLSGFLIGSILIKQRGSRNFLKVFYIRRAARIFPAYYFILFVTGAFALFDFGSNVPFWSYAVYLQNFFMAGTNDFGQEYLAATWSLAVEEQFYLILPFAVMVISKRFLPGLLFLCIVAAPFIRAQSGILGSYVLLPSRMDSLLIGVLIAYYYVNGDIKRFYLRYKTPILSVMAMACVASLWLSIKEPAGGVFIHTTLALLFAGVVISCINMRPNSFWYETLSSKMLGFFARISYMMYLVHSPFLLIFHHELLGSEPRLSSWPEILVTGLALVATIAFCAFSYSYFEKPIQEMGKKFKYESGPALTKPKTSYQ